jgi:hypothetical protein
VSARTPSIVVVAADTWGVLAGIDHVIVAAPDVAVAARALGDSLGMTASGGGRHESHGTYNRLFWLGDSYIELMGVFDPDLAIKSWWGGHIWAATRDGGAAYAGIALAVDDLAGEIERLRALGSAISAPVDGERLRPDGRIVRWRIGRLPAPDPELGLTFLIEHDSAAAEWLPSDRAARAVSHPGGIVRVELPVADVARASMRLLRSLGLQFRPSLAGAGARDASIGSATLRLRPSRVDRRASVIVRAGTEIRDAELLGCHWSVLPLST